MIRRCLALLTVCLGLLVSAASAQCLGPDGLSGPCWTPATANLPAFPGVQLPSTGICWNQCQPQQLCVVLNVATPQFVACGRYEADLRMNDCVPNPWLGGRMVMDYTRTWEEVTPTTPPLRYQVYRFTVKVDLMLVGGALHPCLTPACLATVPTAFYYGYMDYAFDCSTGAVETALVLFHNCDAFIHHPFSVFPGAFHPGTSYALVGPSTVANPFVAAISAPPGGPMIAEALRNVPQLPGLACTTEDPIANGVVNLLGAGCGCQFAAAPPQLTARRITGVGSCVDAAGLSSSFASANTMPNFPWFHMMTTSIGNWTTPFGYPGEEVCWVDEVPIFFKDRCSAAAGGPGAFGEVYYGGSTDKGWPIVPNPAQPLSERFTDLASNTSWKVPGPAPATFMGRVLLTRNLIYFNVP